jgi:hypothetical protein
MRTAAQFWSNPGVLVSHLVFLTSGCRLFQQPARTALRLGLAVTLLAVSVPALAEPPILRIFLRDGTTLTSYGEYVRVGERLVFSLPLGEDRGEPRLQLVSLPGEQVDWARTNGYRDSVRARRYAESQGESDYALMTADVARVLNDIALTTDPAKRLTLATEARRRLSDWPAQHYGYRAADVRQIVGLLDEAVSELGAAAGNAVDLNLVARTDVSSSEPLMPPPSAGETIAQALSLAELSELPAERIALLRKTLAYIDSTGRAATDPPMRAARAFAAERLEGELQADREYAKLAQELAGKAEHYAERANVRGVQSLIQSVEERDKALGRRRPGEISGLIAVLQARLDSARRLRLARDQWRVRSSTYRSYTRLVKKPLADLEALRASLDEIKRLAGPDVERLTEIDKLSQQIARALRVVVPPSELAPVHSLLQSACAMGANAARTRLEAVKSGDMQAAWSASAAASGALMLFTQARDELGRFIAPPTLR